MADEKISSEISIGLRADASSAIAEIEKLKRSLAVLERQQEEGIKQRNSLLAAKRTTEDIVRNEEATQKRISELRERANEANNANAKANFEKQADDLEKNTRTRLAKESRALKDLLAIRTQTTTGAGGAITTSYKSGVPDVLRQALGIQDHDIDAATGSLKKFKELTAKADAALSSWDRITTKRGDKIEALGKLRSILSGQDVKMSESDFQELAGKTSGRGAKGGQSGIGGQSLEDSGSGGSARGAKLPWDPSRFTPEYIAELAKIRSEASPVKRKGVKDPTASKAEVEAQFIEKAQKALAPLKPDASLEDIQAKVSAIQALRAEEGVYLKRQNEELIRQRSAERESAKKTEEISKNSEESAASVKKIASSKKKVAESAKAEEKATEDSVKPAAEVADATKKTRTSRKKVQEAVKAEEKAASESADATVQAAEATKKVRASRKKEAAVAADQEKEAAKTPDGLTPTRTRGGAPGAALTPEYLAEEGRRADAAYEAMKKRAKEFEARAAKEAKAAQDAADASDQVVEESKKGTRARKATAAKETEATQEEAAAIEALQKRINAAKKPVRTSPTVAETKAAVAETVSKVVPKPVATTAAAEAQKVPTAASGAAQSLEKVSQSASHAATQLDRAASAAGSAAGGAQGGGTTPTRTRSAGGGGRAVLPQLLNELKDPELEKVGARVHGLFRKVEAANNPKYVQGFNQISTSIFSIGNASQRAGNAIRRMSDSNAGFLGQIKQVAGMATTYQVLQGIAAELGSLIGHLSGGIIDFNSMIEKTTVGFRTLFQNQADVSLKLARDTGAVNIEMADLSGKIDYISLGYSNAQDAATGMIETIRQFSNVTPFRFEELSETTLRLRAFGFGLDEVLRKSTTTSTGFAGAVQVIGDAVAALGQGPEAFRRISYALGQMKQAGRVYQNDMMQLANAGIGGYNYIADALIEQIATKNKEGQTVAKQGYEQLFRDLQSNKIETIRRLTTAGRISGEVASRAILKGLEKDFGGGMEAYSKTFFGALSTVADSSQSLVAQAFKPLYDSIRDTTVGLAESLQKPEAIKFAQDIAKYVKVAVDVLTKLGETFFKISKLVFTDVVNGISSMVNQTRNLGGVSGSVFKLFGDGLGVIVTLLENDVTRGLILATIALKLFTAAAATNPLLAMISAIIIGLGALKNAYDSNFMGFRATIDATAKKWGPMIQVIQTKVIPLLARIGDIVSGTILVAFVTLFQIIEPTLQGIVDVVGALINQFEILGPIIGAIGSGLVLAIGGTVLISAITRLRNALGGVALSASQIGIEAAYSKGMLDQMTMSAMRANEGALPAGMKPGFVAMGGGKGAKLMAGTIAAQLALSAATPIITGNGENKEAQGIVDATNALLSFLTVVGLIKMILPAGLGAMLSGGLATFVASLAELPIVGGALTSFAAAIPALVALWPIAVVAAVAAIGIALNDFLNSQQAQEFKNYIDDLRKYGKDSGVANEVKVPETSLDESKMIQLMRRSEFLRGDPFQQGLLGTDLFNQAKDDQGNVKKEWADAWAKWQKLKGVQAEIAEQVRLQFLAGERVTDGKEKEKLTTQSIYDLTGLLIEGNKKLANSTERLNFLLDLAKQKYKGALDLLQELANSILNKILNPDIRINPYTGLEQVGLQLEDVLNIQQEMSFAQFENASGTVRSFDEYRSILESILPLSEKDFALKEDGTRSDQISLKAVNERLKIEKQRRKELELIRKAAEAEYDLSIEVLKQYDQSIDPLERAVSLRNAQLKYQKDIKDLEFQSLENIVDEAKVSAAWDRATALTKIKLRELQKGQELILNEMKRMFEEYEQDIANIMADPRLSEAQKKNAATERLNQLMADLKEKFGITEAMLTDEIKYFNDKIDDYIGTLNLEGKNLNVNWGGKFAAALEAGGFGVLKKYLNDQLKEIIRLMALIDAATKAQSATEGDIVLKNRKYYLAIFREKLSWLQSRGLMNDTALRLGRDINIAFAKESNPDILLALRNSISAMLTRLEASAGQPEPWLWDPGNFRKKASGGMVHAGVPYMVGEKGPEMLIPKTSGLVLNNSVSSRLMSMMGGKGSSSSNNVIINVNNPVIRDEQDIRKLADRISRAQVSAFRTAGGRLS